MNFTWSFHRWGYSFTVRLTVKKITTATPDK